MGKVGYQCANLLNEALPVIGLPSSFSCACYLLVILNEGYDLNGYFFQVGPGRSPVGIELPMGRRWFNVEFLLGVVLIHLASRLIIRLKGANAITYWSAQ